MKTASLLFLLGLLAACTPSTDGTRVPAVASPAAEPAEPALAPPPSPAVPQASANGVIKAVDVAARTVTIAHDRIDALDWPAMTMTFAAPDVDLTAIKPGDRVSFELRASGMGGTVIRITPRPDSG